MMTITQLTAIQQTQMATYREKWLKIGLSTEPINRPMAAEAVRSMTAQVGLPMPQLYYVSSPMGALYAYALLKKYFQDRPQVWQQVGQQVADDTAVVLSAEALEGIPLGKIFAQQGDIYLARAELSPELQEQFQPTGQLAPGTTQGSRHCVDPQAVTLYVLPHPDPLTGPVFDAPNGVVITHPEHGNITLPSGTYQVSYQRAYAEELRRVMD